MIFLSTFVTVTAVPTFQTCVTPSLILSEIRGRIFRRPRTNMGVQLIQMWTADVSDGKLFQSTNIVRLLRVAQGRDAIQRSPRGSSP